MIGIMSDISERKKMEQKILENERLASVGQFAGTIAHEIRNPLSSIKMNIQILSKDLKLQGFNKRRLEIASDEIKRLNQIVEDVLDFTKPVQMKKAPYRIEKVIEKGVQLLSDRMRERNVQILQKISRPLPRDSIDWEKMEQAILNILLNAIEAMPIGGVLEIETGRGRTGQAVNMIRVEIKDTGIGICPRTPGQDFRSVFYDKGQGSGTGALQCQKDY